MSVINLANALKVHPAIVAGKIPARGEKLSLALAVRRDR